MVRLPEALYLSRMARSSNLPCWSRCFHCYLLSSAKKITGNSIRVIVGNSARKLVWDPIRKCTGCMVVALLQITWMDSCCRDVLLERILGIGPKIRKRSTRWTALPLLRSISLRSPSCAYLSVKQDRQQCLNHDTRPQARRRSKIR